MLRFHLAATREISMFQEHNLCYLSCPFFTLFCICQPQKSFSWILDSPFSSGSQWCGLSGHLPVQWLLRTTKTNEEILKLLTLRSWRLYDTINLLSMREKQRCLYIRLNQSELISLTPFWKYNRWLKMAGRDPVQYAYRIFAPFLLLAKKWYSMVLKHLVCMTWLLTQPLLGTEFIMPFSGESFVLFTILQPHSSVLTIRAFCHTTLSFTI